MIIDYAKPCKIFQGFDHTNSSNAAENQSADANPGHPSSNPDHHRTRYYFVLAGWL
jgi:hypothetical protein